MIDPLETHALTRIVLKAGPCSRRAGSTAYWIAFETLDDGEWREKRRMFIRLSHLPNLIAQLAVLNAEAQVASARARARKEDAERAERDGRSEPP